MADPREENNLIRSAEHQPLVTEMRNRLFARLEETGGMQIPLRAPAGGRNDRRRPDGAPGTDPLPASR